MMDTRILIADRQALFREVLRRLLELQPDFHVVGDTDDGQHLIKLVSEHKPDILLFDIKLRTASGIEALREITAMGTGVRAILLTDSVGKSSIAQALLWGVCGIVRKDDSTHMLLKCIRSVSTGQYWINHEQVAQVVHNMQALATAAEKKAQQQARNLSKRQQRIIEAIVAGCSNKDIAEEMSLSERTIKYHLTRIFEKLGVSGRMELARYSLKNKVLSDNLEA